MSCYVVITFYKELCVVLQETHTLDDETKNNMNRKRKNEVVISGLKKKLFCVVDEDANEQALSVHNDTI